MAIPSPSIHSDDGMQLHDDNALWVEAFYCTIKAVLCTYEADANLKPDPHPKQLLKNSTAPLPFAVCLLPLPFAVCLLPFALLSQPLFR